MILLDEPTAGMSRSETTRFIHLIKEVTVGRTLLTVEHDMGVVFGRPTRSPWWCMARSSLSIRPTRCVPMRARAGGLPGSAVADAQAEGH